MHRVELMCRQWVCWFQLPPRFLTELVKLFKQERHEIDRFSKDYPFDTANRAWSFPGPAERDFCYLKRWPSISLARKRTNAHCPLSALVFTPALGVVVDNRDSTWHTKASGMLRCNVRSKSRWFIKFCNSYYIFAFCRVLHRCENQEVHRWKVYFVWCVLHSSRWYPSPKVGVKKKKIRSKRRRAEAQTSVNPHEWRNTYSLLRKEENRTNPAD